MRILNWGGNGPFYNGLTDEKDVYHHRSSGLNSISILRLW